MGDSSVTYNPVIDYHSLAVSPPTEWDVLILNGLKTPGIVEIEGFERKINWDVKNTKGTKGATSTVKLLPPAKGKFIFQLWTGLHFTYWGNIFRQLFLYDPTKEKGSPVTVEHPSLVDIGVTSVLAEAVHPVRHVGLNLYIIVIDAIEYKPNTGGNATATPNSPPQNVQNGPNTAKPPGPTDPLQVKIASLIKNLQGP